MQCTRIERSEDGDAARGMCELSGDHLAWWLSIGRNKQSVTLDLKARWTRRLAVYMIDPDGFRIELLSVGPEAATR